MYREYQAHLDNILEELYQAVDKSEGAPDYDHVSFIQTLYGADFLDIVVLIAEMGSFGLFSSPKGLCAYFGLDPGTNDSDKLHEGEVHTSKRGSSLAERILHMVAANSLEVNGATKTPMNPVAYDYCTRRCTSKRKSIVAGVVMHKICNIIFTMLRDSKPSELIAPEEYRECYAAEHPGSMNIAA